MRKINFRHPRAYSSMRPLKSQQLAGWQPCDTWIFNNHFHKKKDRIMSPKATLSWSISMGQRATKINQERNFPLHYSFQGYLQRKQNQNALKCLLDGEKLACAESIRELFNNSVPWENISLVSVPSSASLQVICYINGCAGCRVAGQKSLF